LNRARFYWRETGMFIYNTPNQLPSVSIVSKISSTLRWHC